MCLHNSLLVVASLNRDGHCITCICVLRSVVYTVPFCCFPCVDERLRWWFHRKERPFYIINCLVGPLNVASSIR